ncbi:serine hydrolase domain-containing protein [Liquorilactobacillus oeni]|uniref:Penicillin-binding protein (Beta-lactamase class C) n=1 Tax=Liquorilactobacillus oeni DSM 19972 TaxID=1423777 RepID=A0A0R1MKQ7_9LACO|nr:serine hydrolase [Liquorilactobacillus oeni]KRL05989.1 Penicillin-binding protein (Beta-lactamase class C) [Liquorilactobacillus oeni DSM 19972]
MNKKKLFLRLFLLFIVVGIASKSIMFFDKANRQTQKQTIFEKNKIKKVDEKQKCASALKNFCRYADQQLKKNNFVGEALIIKNGKVVYQRGYGYANLEERRPNDSRSTYQIASLQKAATAMMIMQLEKKKRISLSDTLAKFYPKIKFANLVTIREMLNMTSGVSLSTLPQTVLSPNALINYTSSKIQIQVKSIGQQNYQPANYVLLAGILQKVTQQGYEQSFEKMIKKPLGLTETYFFDGNAKMMQNKALAYSQGQNKFLKEIKEKPFQYSNELGTGNLYMSVPDLYRMLSGFLSDKLLTSYETKILYTTFPPKNNYSAGLYHLAQLPQFTKRKIKSGYHIHGCEYGYETIGDLSVHGKNAVILQSNVANVHGSFNLTLDTSLYYGLSKF